MRSLILMFCISFSVYAMERKFYFDTLPKDLNRQIISVFVVDAAHSVDTAKDTIGIVLKIDSFKELETNDRNLYHALHKAVDEKFKQPSKKEQALITGFSKGMFFLKSECMNPEINLDAIHEGTTLLHQAVNALNGEAVSLLLELRADPNIYDKDDLTPLTLLMKKFKNHVWCEGPSIFHRLKRKDSRVQEAETIAKLLLEAKADPNKWENVNSLHFASRAGWICMVGLLIHYGSETNFSYADTGKPIFSVLCKKWLEDAKCDCYKEIPLMFLKAGVNLNYQDKEGETVLFDACTWKKIEIMKMLLEHKPDLKIKNKKGESVLMKAIQCGTDKHVKLLQQYGAQL